VKQIHNYANRHCRDVRTKDGPIPMEPSVNGTAFRPWHKFVRVVGDIGPINMCHVYLSVWSSNTAFNSY